jgi:hypothetical protein
MTFSWIKVGKNNIKSDSSNVKERDRSRVWVNVGKENDIWSGFEMVKCWGLSNDLWEVKERQM